MRQRPWPGLTAFLATQAGPLTRREGQMLWGWRGSSQGPSHPAAAPKLCPGHAALLAPPWDPRACPQPHTQRLTHSGDRDRHWFFTTSCQLQI